MSEVNNKQDILDSRDIIERIAELQDMIATRYVAGYNMPGYLPDSEPCEFDNQEDAKDYIISVIERLLEDLPETTYLSEQYESLLDEMANQPDAFDDDFSFIVGNYCFWVKEDGEMGLDEYDREELDILLKLQEECEGYSDWKYGETLIRESYWEDYVQELVEELGYISKDFPWWIEVNWGRTAENVAQDYTTVDFDGTDYYIRSC